MAERPKTRPPIHQGSSGAGIPAGTAKEGGADKRPDIGGTEGGKRIRHKTETTETEALAPEARGGAGAGRKWAGDS
ncbi:hypothetical protein [Falsiroseomonas selenitidurans]|uniref:Uncharacterized protein n=1 Tax=Falsiroseomonas selenitidurans TaxID=2716335 RepID=A0ABX1E7C9_9PROT|nr:hypothetical protein [Falsiroseomonas selenitidurans]NKC32841.1 hypothetical protein [Falsiroseomonas selenitidurans]OYW92775.1 MAG: hypothetical protein B7Z13_09070 [Caulobacterales bacterium 32-67-6]